MNLGRLDPPQAYPSPGVGVRPHGSHRFFFQLSVIHPRKCLVFLAVVRETHHLVCATCEEAIKRMSIKLLYSDKKNVLGSDSSNIRTAKISAPVRFGARPWRRSSVGGQLGKGVKARRR